MSWRHRRIALLVLPLLAAAAQRLWAAGPAAAQLGWRAWPAWVAVAAAPWLLDDPLGRERQCGTIELLWSLPVRDVEVAAGKFVAGWGLCLLALLPSAWPLVLTQARQGWSLGASLGQLGALALVAAAVCALSLACSALAVRRRAGQLGATALGLTLWGLGWPATWLPQGLAPWLDYLSLPHHMQALAHGRIDSRDLVYFLTIIVGALAVGSSSLCRQGAEV